MPDGKHRKSWTERHGGIDKRKGDRHKDKARDEGRPRSGRRIPKWVKGDFLAVDGEGWTVEGRHLYVLLGTSDRSIYDKDGLTFEQCADFLLSLADRKVWLVGFSFNYDVVMMLKGLPDDFLKRLHRTGLSTLRTKQGDYRVRYVPSKFFVISKGEWAGKTFEVERSVTVYDTFGFFQAPFVGTLKRYGLLSESDEKFLTRMKARRGRFTEKNLDEIKRYNCLECQYLERLMDKLHEAFQEAEIPVSKWHGAGAASAALLRKHKVKDILEQIPSEAEQAGLVSYYGGRIEILQSGEFGACFSYDIRSAYPFALSELSGLTGRFEKRGRFDGSCLGVWRVKWELPKGSLAPFPFRYKRRIHWPRVGEGWYTHYEVGAALAAYGPSRVKVIEGMIFESDGARPYAFVNDLYNRRAEFKSRGSAAEKAVKLGLNSLYGKFAQGQSFDSKAPAHRSYFVASLITSRIRSELFKASFVHASDIVSFSTDGILSLSPLDVEEGDTLGAWEVTPLTFAFVLQPGVYVTSAYARHRGFRSSEFDFEEVRKCYAEKSIYLCLPVDCTRFIGLGYAVANDRLDLLGEWVVTPREITGKTIKITTFDGNRVIYVPLNFPNEVSEIYRPKGEAPAEEQTELEWFRVDADQPDGFEA